MLAALIPIVVPLLLGLFKAHPAATDSSTPLPSWITALEAILANAPTTPWTSITADLNNFAALIADISTNGTGLVPAPIITSLSYVTAIFGKYSAVQADYMSDQTAVLDSAFVWDQKPGDVIALSKTEQAKPIPPGSVTIADAVGLT